MEQAEKLLFLVADPVTTRYLERLNSSAESLHSYYETGKPRFDSYSEMVDRIMAEVRRGMGVCVAFYGHPGIFVYPSHEAIWRARDEGYPAKLLPGISAEDCLFAELNLDPAMTGCQSYEATDFLLHRRRIETSSALVLWQIGVIGDLSFQGAGYDNRGLEILISSLEPLYGPEHGVILYEAAQFAIADSRIEEIPLGALRKARISAHTTLFVPPKTVPPPDPEMAKLLGIDLESVPRTSISLAIRRRAGK
jgi:uncharacterized protein YabN with tetrapyrrole methylase and pyrophosphatase domain